MSTPSSSSFGSDVHYTNGIHDLVQCHDGQTCAIIGTGTSLEGYDFGELERLGDRRIWTIGINGAVRLTTPDYWVCCDPRAFSKHWSAVHPDTTLILGERVFRGAIQNPHWHPGSSTTSADILEDAAGVHVLHFAPHPGGRPIPEWLYFDRATLTSALTLADALGFSTALLLGVDLYRTTGQTYALDIEPAAPGTLEGRADLPDGVYTTPEMRAQRDAVEHAADRWSFDQVVNLSRYSLLRCWPIDPELALPRI